MQSDIYVLRITENNDGPGQYMGGILKHFGFSLNSNKIAVIDSYNAALTGAALATRPG